MKGIFFMNYDELKNIFNSFNISSNDGKNLLLELEENMRKQQILEKHNYQIFEAKKGEKLVYRTYVIDEATGKRKLLERVKKEALEEQIFKYYTIKNSFKNVLNDWKFFYKTTVKNTTFDRTNSDINRFFINNKVSFYDTEIAKIKRIEIKEFINKTIIDFNLKEQGLRNLKIILNGIFNYAMDKELINDNPMLNLKIPTANIINKTKKTKTESVWVNSEKQLLIKSIWDNKNNWKESSHLLLLLYFQTGLRVSEMVALKWEDINLKSKTIHIQRQEIIYNEWNEDLTKKNKKSIHIFVDYTKTSEGNRLIPLTNSAIEILEEIKDFNNKNNINNDFVFVTKKGKFFNRQRVNTLLYTYCDKLGIDRKSSHKIRRTVLSTLLDNVSNKKAIQAFAGHKDIETTLKSYYRDITDENEFCECLNNIL